MKIKYFFSILRNYNLFDFVRLFIFKYSSAKRYTYSNIKNIKWAYISYIPEAFYRKNDNTYLNTHQNKRESLVIGQAFADNGYNFVVESFDTISLDNRKYDIIFGLEPNFCKLAKMNPSALKIYYATGAYYKHQNLMVNLRTDYFNEKHSSNVPYYRKAIENEASVLADYIFQIGSKYTIETYPQIIVPKISLITQSSNFYRKICIEEKVLSYNRNEFIWLGGGGSLLKGLDLVLDFFLSHQEYKLHIVGHIDEEVNQYYRQEIANCTNILFHGFMDLNTNAFINLVSKITFGIFPSASEGFPGAVIASMKCGIIPITSRYAAFDEINDLGFMLNGFTVEDIEEAIQWAAHLEEDRISILIKENYKYAKKWSLSNFAKEFNDLLKNKIDTFHT